MTKREARVLAVILSRNCGKSLPFVLSEIPRGMVDGVMAIDCGSFDNSIPAAKQGGAKVLSGSAGEPGKAAVLSIPEMALYEPDIVVFLDCYYRYYPRQIYRLIEPIVEANYDLVLGNRPLEGCKENPLSLGAMYWQNKIAASLKGEVYRLSDATPFRAARFRTLKQIKLNSSGIEWLVELPARAFRLGFRVCEVPVCYNREAPQEPDDMFNEDSFSGRRRIYNAFMRYRHLLR